MEKQKTFMVRTMLEMHAPLIKVINELGILNGHDEKIINEILEFDGKKLKKLYELMNEYGGLSSEPKLIPTAPSKNDVDIYEENNYRFIEIESWGINDDTDYLNTDRFLHIIFVKTKYEN